MEVSRHQFWQVFLQLQLGHVDSEIYVVVSLDVVILKSSCFGFLFEQVGAGKSALLLTSASSWFVFNLFVSCS